MESDSQIESSVTVRIRCHEFAMPPIRDAIILGKNSPIGCEAMRRALKILQPQQFDHIELADKDDVVGDILVRSSILKRVSKDKFVEMVLRRFKPVMEADECLHLEINTELIVEDTL